MESLSSTGCINTLAPSGGGGVATSPATTEILSNNKTRLWTLRVIRGDDHHLLIPVQVFPEASIWELKVCISYAVGVDPDQITLKCIPPASSPVSPPPPSSSHHLPLSEHVGGEEVSADGALRFKTLPGGISLLHMSRLGIKDLAIIYMTREQGKKKRLVVRGGVDPATALSQAVAGIVMTAPLVAAADQHKRFTKAQSLAHVRMLPTRQYLSQQLVETIVEMAKHPLGYHAAVGKHAPLVVQPSESSIASYSSSSPRETTTKNTPTVVVIGAAKDSSSSREGQAYRYLLERVDLGESLSGGAIDQATGYNALQLALLHARNPGLVLLLLQEKHCAFRYCSSTTSTDSEHGRQDPGKPTATSTLEVALRFTRRYPDNPLTFDEESLPLLMCCDLMLDTELLLKEDRSKSHSSSSSSSSRVCPIESALVFAKVFPRLMELLIPSLPMLRQNQKVMTRVRAAVETLESQYFRSPSFSSSIPSIAGSTTAMESSCAFSTPETREAVLSAFQKLYESG